MRLNRRQCLSAFAAIFAVRGAFAADKQVPDNLLFDRVNQRLVGDRELGVRPLSITVEDGKVTVTGYVETDKLKKRVDKVVRKVKGVREVDNQVQIRQ